MDEDLDPATVSEVLDGIEGAYERAEEGRSEAERGEGIPADDL